MTVATALKLLLSLTLVPVMTCAAYAQTMPLTPEQTAPKIQNPEQMQEAPAAIPQEGLKIRIVPKDAFCKRLQMTFIRYGANTGYTKSQTAMLASTASHMVIQEFRNGRATDYMNAAALAHYADQPSLAPKDSYLQLAGFIGAAMGLSDNVSLALSTGELRFIPYAPRDSDIVVIAQNAVPLTPQRAQKIIEVAQSLKVRISVLWVGTESIEAAEAEKTRLLGWIVGSTGGFLSNLGGADNTCGTLM